MTRLGELRLPARHENLRIISHFIHGIAHRLSLSEKSLFDIELATEEAATNIINHAYPDHDIKGDIVIRVDENDGLVQITLTDWGEPLNPDDVKPFDINAPIETRIKGGMGLHFIHRLMDAVARTTTPGPVQENTLTLIKRVERVSEHYTTPSAVQELNAMRTVSEVMTSNINLDDLLNLIVSKLVSTINAARGTLYLLDETTDELWSRVLQDDVGPLSEIRLPVGAGIAGYVAKTGKILNIPNAYDDSRFDPSFDQTTGFQTRSILTAPMFNPQQKIIGVVQLLNKRGGPFTFRDERLLSAMASQAAISIENARLYEQEIQQQVISRELETARSIQASFLPDTIPEYAGWDIGATWHPIRNVAGDFYDFYVLEDGRLASVIADVSGKGIPAALFMALSVTVIRFGMQMNLKPHEVTRRANELIISEQRSRMFATTFVSYIDPSTGNVEFSSGGHNPALVYRANSQRCDYITSSGVAIGIFKGADFDCGSTSLSPGDILVLYTDGITEVINNDEEEFGENRLENLIIQNAHRSSRSLIDLIMSAVETFSEDQELFDDATLVIIKRNS